MSVELIRVHTAWKIMEKSTFFNQGLESHGKSWYFIFA